MAEAMLAQQLVDAGVSVSSSGIAALIGYPADPKACQVMQERGYDISQHRAQQATQSSLTTMDLILTLDQTHSDWIRSRFPQLQGRVYKLGRWRGNADIADPYQKPLPAFEQACVEIEASATDWANRLKKL